MKVLYYAFQYYCENGARTHARSFFRALSDHPEVSEVVIFPPDDEKLSLDSNGTVLYKPCSSDVVSSFKRIAIGLCKLFTPKFIRQQIKLYWPSPAIYRELSSMITRQQPDVIVLRFGSRFRYIQKLRKDFPRLRICVEYNASIFDEWLGCIPGRSLWRREEIRQLGFADSISVVSKYLYRSLLSKSPSLKDKIFVNPNGADTEMFKPLGKIVRTESRLEMGIPDDAVVLGYVGGMESIRRIPEIVSRVAELRRSGLDKIFLVLIGAGQDLEAVLQAIDNYPDLENWVYCSRCWEPHQRIPSLMAAFDMVIFSDFYPYSSPLKIFEYMSYALPIVGPDISAVTDFLDDENMPFLFHRDGSNFDEVVRHVYNNLGLCRAKALRNRDLVKQKYTWAANVSRFVDAINVASSARYKL